MKKLSILLCSVLIISSVSCKKPQLLGINGKGNPVTKTIQASGFSKIALAIDATVTYMQDSVYKVEISAQENLQEVIEAYTEGGTLKIGSDRNIWQHKPIRISVHSPNMYALHVSSSGEILVPGPLNSASLDLWLSGSGTISAASLTTEHLKANITGSGTISLSGGATGSESLHISGSGKIDALAIQANTCTAHVSGSGDIYTHVGQELTAKISGSGNVNYKGNPKVNFQVSGSGRLIHIN